MSAPTYASFAFNESAAMSFTGFGSTTAYWYLYGDMGWSTYALAA